MYYLLTPTYPAYPAKSRRQIGSDPSQAHDEDEEADDDDVCIALSTYGTDRMARHQAPIKSACRRKVDKAPSESSI